MICSSIFSAGAVACTLSLSLLGQPATTAGDLQDPPTWGPSSSSSDIVNAVDASVTASGGVGLVRAHAVFPDMKREYSETGKDIPSGGLTGFFVGERSADKGSATVTYQIFDGAHPTPYFAQMQAIAGAFASCEIYVGDPDIDGTRSTNSPYDCNTHTPRDDNQDPWMVRYDVTTRPGVTVTDPTQQAELLKQCSAQAANCSYRAVSSRVISQSRDLVGGILQNPLDTSVTHGVLINETISASDTVGTSFKAGVDVFDVFNFDVSVSYSHTWTTSRSITDTETMTVPPHTRGWYSMDIEMLQVTGDFYVSHAGRDYIVRSVTATLPMKDSAPRYTAHQAPYTGTRSRGIY